MEKQRYTFWGMLIGLAVFTAALWVLHRELRTYHFADIMKNLKALPSANLILALFLTGLSYSVMTGYDFLALRYVKKSQPFHRVALASFAGYAFSNNIGLSMLAGASVRYRLYSAWGLSTLEITRIIIFCSLSIWLGFLMDAGLLFLFYPLPLLEIGKWPFASSRVLGIVFIGLVAGYFLIGARSKKPMRIWRFTYDVPSPRLFVPQLTIAILDWMLAGGVLWALLPESTSLNFPGFLSLFLLSQLAGLASQIPGGLGVFETASLMLLSPHCPPPVIMSALIAYRAIYYLLPLVMAATLFAGQEVLQARSRLLRVGSQAAGVVSAITPHLLAASTFLGGVILLASGATPAVASRLYWINDVLPLPVIETSHFIGSLVGAILLVLALGLLQRIDFAYVVTCVLLGVGIVVSLLKGLDYEEATILALMLASLLPSHKFFHRRASLLRLQLSPLWIGSVALVLVSILWLMFFSYKHVEYSNALWWRFALSGNAPRSLRAMAGIAGVVLVLGLIRLMRPASPEPAPTTPDTWNQVVGLVGATGDSQANLALLGDKSFLFGPSGRSFIMYGVEGRSWVSMGNPIGDREEWSDLVWEFHEMSNRHRGWTIFYKVGPRDLTLYTDLGLSFLKIGEEARVPLDTFSLQGGSRKGLRYTVGKLEKSDTHFEIIPTDQVPEIMPELQNISDAWLQKKQAREKGFSLGFFSETYIRRFPVGVVRDRERIVAFANLWPTATKGELSIDLMRSLPDAPAGVMEYLFIKLMLWAKEEGYQEFNLGMAPLSGLEERALTPLWLRVEHFLYRHGEHFYNFQGLRQFKEKFNPVWTSQYLVSPGGLALPRILIDLVTLSAGGLKGAVAK